MSYISENVEEYLAQLMPIEDELLAKLQQEGIEHEVPIIQVPSIRLIQTMIKLVNPSVIIEVGTAIGFSAIWLAKTTNAVIHTIERDPLMIEKAKKNISRAGLEKQIILHEGDAREIIPTLPKAELIFIDAAKGKYKTFLELAFPLLKVGGVFIFDNVLFRGFVADENILATKPMLRKLNRFNHFLAAHPKLETSFISIGDGLAISYKLEE